MKFIHIFCVLLSASFSFAEEPVPVPISELGQKYELVGKLHVPIGKLTLIEGVAVEGPFKGYEGGPNLRVQRIDGRFTQEDIQIVISPYWGKWGDTSFLLKYHLPKLEMGRTYQMEGYETGEFVGIPDKAYELGGIMMQTTRHYLLERLTVIRAKPINPITASPGMFADKQALIGGIARSQDGRRTIVGEDWVVIVARGGGGMA
jgi:hypothetical protein